jgi:serine/threonine-protein kinase
MREDLMRALHGRPVEATPVLSDATGVISPLSDETVVIERGRGMRAEAAPRDTRRRTGWILLGLIIAAILGVAIWAALGLVGGAKTVTIPDLRGKTAPAAIDQLQKLGLKTDLQDPINSSLPIGQVVRTDPPAGTKTKTGKVVRVFYSGGPALVAVPDVRNKTLAEATSLLERAKLKVGNVTRESSDTIASGHVISQDPSGGFAKVSQKVDLVISSGPPTQAVPNVVGLSQQDATDALQRANFQVQVVNEDISFSCNEPEGFVCRQDPASGEKVKEGSTVTIYVAQSPGGGGSPSPTETTTPTETPSP